MAKKVLLRDWNNDEVLPITRGELVLDSSGKEAFRSTEFLATTSQPGLMSTLDKIKIDNMQASSLANALTLKINNGSIEGTNLYTFNGSVAKILNIVAGDNITLTPSVGVLSISATTSASIDAYTKAESDNRYLQLIGGTLSGRLTIESGYDSKIVLNNNDTDNKYQFISFRQNGEDYGQLGTAGSDDLLWGKEGYWKTIIHSGNIGDYAIKADGSNALTNYTKATSISAITTTDTLTAALGKLELKADTAYSLVAGAYDGDGTIENLAEILKVLEGIKDTETIQAIVGKYLPLSGGTINGNLKINYDDIYPLYINGAEKYSVIQLQGRDKRTAEVGWLNDDRGNFAFLYNVDSPGILSVNEHGAYYSTSASNFTQHTLIHSGNYSSYALPLSGGKITGSITFTRDGVDKGIVSYGDTNGMYITEGTNFLGILANGTPHYNRNTLIHSGNIGEQSVAGLINEVVTNLNDATYGRTFTMTSGYGSTDGNKPDVGWVTGITLRHANNAQYRTQLAITTQEKMYLRRENGGAWQSWHEFAFTDSNVASATKLQDNTAYTAWGQTFFENGVPKSVSGNLHLNVNRLYWHSDSKNYCIYSYYDGSSTYLNIKDYGNILFYTSAVERMRIINNGNVLIGTTENNGNKLQVSGNISADNLWPIHTISKSLTITSDWTDTGITFNATNFPHGNGSYMVQIDHGNSYFYTGVISVVINDGAVTANDVDEIILHGGGFDSAVQYYLRTKQDASSKTTKIQIATSGSSHTKTINFKFKRII